MLFNRKILLVVPLFVLFLVLLRQGIVALTQEFQVLERQINIMQQQEIDPAALFYTDSRVALQAIRNVDRRINGD